MESTEYQTLAYPLHSFASMGDLNSLRASIESLELIDPTFSPNIFNKYGVTPLHSACYFGHTDIVKLLLEKKADVNAFSKSRDNSTFATPLHYAAVSGSKAVIAMLLSYGANPFLKDHKGYTPYDVALLQMHKRTALFLMQCTKKTFDDLRYLSFSSVSSETLLMEQQESEKPIPVISVDDSSFRLRRRSSAPSAGVEFAIAYEKENISNHSMNTTAGTASNSEFPSAKLRRAFSMNAKNTVPKKHRFSITKSISRLKGKLKIQEE